MWRKVVRREIMIKVAITGGIGSGKSTAADILRNFGYKCESADGIYRELLADEGFVEKISEHMGIAPIICDGKKVLDKQSLSGKVFGNKNELKKLNDFAHPAVMDVLMKNMEKRRGDSVTFAEVPVLFEGGFDRLFDYVVVIKKDIESRVLKTMDRDGKSADDVKRVIAAQVDYDNIEENGKFIVVKNDGTIEELKENLKRAVAEILQKDKKQAEND